VLTGVSGAGKSTLLRVLAGALPPMAGVRLAAGRILRVT
jgi:ABC-type sulfate/molybdate transport systems ATPase subunit